MKTFEPRIHFKDFTAALVLVSNSLIWYILAYMLFSNAINNLQMSASQTLILFAAYYVGIAFSAIVGALVFPRARETALLLWMLAGVIMTVLLTTIATNSMAVNVLVSLFLGVSIGAGLPSSLAYFADVTAIENRGTYGGIIWSVVGFGTLALALLLNSLSTVLAFAVLALWRAFGLVAFFFSKGERKISVGKTRDFRSILGRREMLLYLIPWTMFSLVNFIEAPMLQSLLGDFFIFVVLIEFALSGIFALVGGLLADIVGRKRVVITGFVVLGIEYAGLSLFSGMRVSWYLYTVFDSVAWGMFAAVFFMTLWGDLAEESVKEKYYLLGGLPYLLAGFLSVLVKPYTQTIQTMAAFSFASFFLFLAVIPLIYAPETLPEKRIKERELREYIDKAKKAKEKHA
jgi:MFS family permease